MTALSSRIPLRTSAVWGEYREARAIPHRYGATGGAMLQYDSTRQAWVWADHAVLSIDDVIIDGQIAGGWAWANETDATGHAVAVVRFTSPVDEGAEVTARGRGKLDSDAGGLMTNPGAVLHDVLARIAGLPFGRARTDVFRAECAAAQIEVAGSVEDGESTVQRIARDLCDSVGAVFAPDAQDIAFLWPGGNMPPARLTVRAGHALVADAAADDLVTDLTLEFDLEDGEPRQVVQLDVPAAVSVYGRLPRVIRAPWIAEGRVAVNVATRLLQQWARATWAVQIEGLEQRLGLGDAVTLSHAVLPIGGAHRVLSREADLDRRACSIGLRVPAGPVPDVRLVRQSTLIEPQQYAAASVTSVPGARVIRITGDDGQPIAGAAVTLNGETTRNTDAAGNVEFPVSLMPAGQHVLTVLAPDGRAFQVTVQV